MYIWFFNLFCQFFESLNLMSLSGRWGDSINHGVWKPWLRAIKWTQENRAKTEFEVCKSANAKLNELFMLMFMLYEDKTTFQHTDSYESTVMI